MASPPTAVVVITGLPHVVAVNHPLNVYHTLDVVARVQIATP
jgi:hypothetical protein